MIELAICACNFTQEKYRKLHIILPKKNRGSVSLVFEMSVMLDSRVTVMEVEDGVTFANFPTCLTQFCSRVNSQVFSIDCQATERTAAHLDHALSQMLGGLSKAGHFLAALRAEKWQAVSRTASS